MLYDIDRRAQESYERNQKMIYLCFIPVTASAVSMFIGNSLSVQFSALMLALSAFLIHLGNKKHLLSAIAMQCKERKQEDLSRTILNTPLSLGAYGMVTFTGYQAMVTTTEKYGTVTSTDWTIAFIMWALFMGAQLFLIHTHYIFKTKDDYMVSE